MGFFSQKSSWRGKFWFQVSLSVWLAALFIACGDDSGTNANKFPIKEAESSSSQENAKSSSSSVVVKTADSSSSSKTVALETSSSQAADDELDDLLDVIYALWDGEISGNVALDDFAKTAKVNMVQLDSTKNFAETGITFSGSMGKGGSYEIKKIDLPYPYVSLSAEGSISNVVDDKSATVSLSTLADVTSAEVFNLNLLTTLETERALEQLNGKNKISFETAKAEATKNVWDMFHLESADFDITESILASDASESGAALLGASVLLQAGANGDFAKFFKSVVADVRKDGKWDDSTARVAIADWALTMDLNDGYVALRKTLEKRMSKVSGFEKYLKNFYLKELRFPECDSKNLGAVFFVNNKLSSFYAAEYSDITKSKERFICDEKAGWKSIPDSLKDFMGASLDGEDGEVRRGEFSGEFFVYDGSAKEWRKATAVEKDRYFVKLSNVKAFVDIQDAYESIKDGERLIIVLRHAERGDDTSKSGLLTENGKKQSEGVGRKLTKFKDDFVLGASEFVRAHQTVESIAIGRGQNSDKHDTIPELNDDWYIKNKSASDQASSECGGGWHSTSKYAYTGAYSVGEDAAFYNLAERSVELIEDVLLKKYPTERFVILSSHDKLMVPLVAYCSNLQLELKEYDGGNWINYLAGIAIFVDEAGNRRYVAVRGLSSGFMK